MTGPLAPTSWATCNNTAGEEEIKMAAFETWMTDVYNPEGDRKDFDDDTLRDEDNVFSNYFVEDASYVRIQNVQLGYTLNPEISKRAGVSKLRLYAGVNNLYTFTKYKGFDPGASFGPTNRDNTSQSPIGAGIDYGFYPIPRTYLLGLNINF